MNTTHKFSGFAAFYLAASYIIGIALFLVVLDYPGITDPAQKVALIVEQQGVIFWTNLLMYVFFGVVLVPLALALYDLVKSAAPALAKVATVIAIIWAGSLVASGMISNAGIGPVVALYAKDPAQAAITWQTIETVTSGIGNGNGEILGGVWTLLISLAALRTDRLPKILNYLGLLVGTVGIVSVFPGLTDLTGLFGISQIVWYIWLGIIFSRSKVS